MVGLSESLDLFQDAKPPRATRNQPTNLWARHVGLEGPGSAQVIVNSFQCGKGRQG
jgi:hypothetical protein